MGIKQYLSDQKWKLKYHLAKRAYNKATPSSYYLNDDLFKEVEEKYKIIPANHAADYSLEGQTKLGTDRYKQLLSLTKNKKIESVCEIGPGSGTVLKEFIKNGTKEVYGVDIHDGRYEKDGHTKMILKGVHYMGEIPDNSVDLVYSFDAFEHLPNIENAFNECFRKLKIGAIMYIKVGPPFYSPWGYHYYHILKAPYIHLLFKEDIILEYAKSKNKEVVYTNRIQSSRYIDYLKNLPENAKLLSCNYDYDWYSSDIIKKYPGVFKAKRVDFIDFFVSSIDVIIRKEY